MSCCTTASAPRPALSAGSVILLALRLFLGGVFLLAALVKLKDPQQFAFAINAYQVLPTGAKHLVPLATFVVPWLELIAGLLLLLGLWGRAAALVAASLMALFTAAVASVILRDMSITCGCFGKLKGPFGCEGPIGPCKLAENATLLLAGLVLTFAGPGRLSVEALTSPRRRTRCAE